MAESTRIDKYLWAIRVFKTRGDATDACRGGKVQVNGISAKPSRTVSPSDIITLRRGAATYTYKVLAVVEKRQGAKLVPQFVEDLTPQSELDKLRQPTFFVSRDPGTGRPTKKDRRQMEEVWGPDSDYTDDFSNEYSDDWDE